MLMTSRPPPARDPVAAADPPGRAPGRPRRRTSPPPPVRIAAYAAVGWCLSFAGVSAWQGTGLLGPPDPGQRAGAAGLVLVSVLVGVLKLIGAVLALAAVQVWPGRPRRLDRLLGLGLWGAVGLLGPYSAGNLVITAGTVSGLLAPSAAWTAAGGVTPKAVGYVAFFLVGSALFGVLAGWFHRRHRLGWPEAAAGLAGAPLLLWLLLAAAPAILGRWGLLST
jgi:hypothetical protein